MSILDFAVLIAGLVVVYALGRWDGRTRGEDWAYAVLSRRWDEATTYEAREALREAQAEVARLDD